MELVVPAGMVTRTFFQPGLGHRGQRSFVLARCYSVAALSAWPHFSLPFLTGLILPRWVGALASALFSCVLHYLGWLPGALCGFLAGSPIVVKFLRCAMLRSGGGQGRCWGKSCLPLCLMSGLAVALRGGVSSPNAELPEALAALCRPVLSPWALRPCL